jgi:ubiquinone/menaquinone biosynthesis C-methylase UbiE
MNANKALWEKGDFSRIAATMRTSGERFVDQIGITAGAHVLDLGSGDGTTAVPAAKLGAHVLGVDIASNLVAAGNRRAAALGLSNLRFQAGDASDLTGIDDQVFDLTVSVFGAMFAPKPFVVANEMVRVTGHGGRIVMANWIPDDPTMVAQLLRISSAYAAPPPAGFVSPMTWGRKGQRRRAVRERGRVTGPDLMQRVDVHVPPCRLPLGLRPHVPQLLRTHPERVRGGRGQWARRRPAAGARGALRRAERQRDTGHHHDPGDLPPRRRRCLRGAR